jgi:hypothetical protein
VPDTPEGGKPPRRRSLTLLLRGGKAVWGSRAVGAVLTGLGAAVATALLVTGVVPLPTRDESPNSTATTSPAVPTSPFGSSHVLSSDRIGDYQVRADGTSSGAEKEFGEPTDRARNVEQGDCTMTWNADDVRITFYNLGGYDPCRRGRFCRARIEGPLWQTTKGLQIGESVRRLQRLYPGAKEFPAGEATFWALEPTGLACGRDARQGGLNAIASEGKIVAFTISHLAGGD